MFLDKLDLNVFIKKNLKPLDDNHYALDLQSKTDYLYSSLNISKFISMCSAIVVFKNYFKQV